MRKIIGSIDIGTDTIKLVVGEFYNNKINILLALSVPSAGLTNHQVTNIEEFKTVIKKIITDASEQLGFKVRKFIVNIPTSKNEFTVSHVENTINSDDNIINGNDILRVMQTAAYNKIADNEELVSVVPISFSADEEEIDKPFGKKAKKLGLKAILVTAPKKEIHAFVTILEECGVDVIDITTSGLVDYYNFKNNYHDEKTGVIINLGHYRTTLSVFSRGRYINNEILETGGAFVDRDISMIYNLDLKSAKDLKEKLALGSVRKAIPKETARMVNKAKEEVVINQYELSEVVGSRIEDMLKLSKKSINLLTKKEISYIIITGGLTELKDFPLALTSVFGNKAKIGTVNTIGIRSNKYSVALGMIQYFNDKLSLRQREYSTVNEAEADVMCSVDAKMLSNDSILGKVFGYFFDN